LTEIGFSGNKRYGAAVFTYQNTAYLVTGVNNGALQTDFWKFDPSAQTQKWTQLRKITNSSNETYDDGYDNSALERGCFCDSAIPTLVREKHLIQFQCFGAMIFRRISGQRLFRGTAVTGAVGFSLSSTIGSSGFISTGRTTPGQAGSSDFVWEFFRIKMQIQRQ
jgi:hypothetical protein